MRRAAEILGMNGRRPLPPRALLPEMGGLIARIQSPGPMGAQLTILSYLSILSIQQAVLPPARIRSHQRARLSDQLLPAEVLVSRLAVRAHGLLPAAQVGSPLSQAPVGPETGR